MAGNQSDSGNGVVLLVVGAVVVAVALVAGAVWNLTVTVAYCASRWVPPVLACGAIYFLPSIMTRIVCEVHGQHPARFWTEKLSDVRSAWRRCWASWMIMPCIVLAVCLWNLLLPPDSSWLAGHSLPLVFQETFRWNQATIEGWYAQSCRHPGFLLLLPAVASSLLLHRTAEGTLVLRIATIRKFINGEDQGSGRLVELDKELSAGYGRLGIERAGEHLPAYRAWLVTSTGLLLRDARGAANRSAEQIRLATLELTCLKESLVRYEAARGAYQQGLVRLRKVSSLALLGSLEDAGLILVSPGLQQLVEKKQWSEVNAVLDELATELARIDALAEEWSRAATAGGSVAMPGGGALTREAALDLLGLPQRYAPAQVHERRKQFARIYHPDMAQDKDQRERNSGRMGVVNMACDLLLEK